MNPEPVPPSPPPRADGDPAFGGLLLTPTLELVPRWLGQPVPALPGSPVAGQAAPPLRWLWPGYLAAGKITLLTSLWKSGKTTLTALLLARMKAGGTLAGEPVQRGKALVASEESHEDWEDRCRRLDLAGHVCVMSRPFRGLAAPADWERLIDHTARLQQQFPFDLLVIDPLASLLPANCEFHAKPMLAALLPLRDTVAACGFAC